MDCLHVSVSLLYFFPQMERDREMFAVNGSCFTAIQGGIFFVK